MIIQHNLVAMNANRQFGINSNKTKRAMEKLSSGYKINRASDDAAGLSISEKMRRQIRGLSQSADNIQEGAGYVQVADGALNEAHDILQRMNELVVKSANGTNTETDRSFIDEEVQQLKEELERIFTTTSFNDKLIWVPEHITKVQVDTESRQAVTFNGSGHNMDITNDNCGIVAYGNYQLKADQQGVNVSWTGYDGKAYETQKIDWDTLEARRYSFEMSDYYDKVTLPQLFDAKGNPVLKNKISFTVQENATIDDMIACIDGTTFSSFPSVSMMGRFEDKNGNAKSGYMSVTDVRASYDAAYVSHVKGTNGRNFDAADDSYLEAADSAGNQLGGGNGKGNVISLPSATTVADARNSTEGWQLSFCMEGIGKVTAKSSSISYYAPSDTSTDDEGVWWDWRKVFSNGHTVNEKYAKERTVGTGTLGDVMDVLTGTKNETTPGLLNSGAGGCADNGGYIEINFNMTADNAYSAGSVSGKTTVGSFALKFHVEKTDTEDSVLQKIQNALNDTAIVDFYTSSKSNDSAYMGVANANTHKIDVPIWEIQGAVKEFYVQGGAEAGQHIEVSYDCLNLKKLKLEDTNALTIEDSEKAIDSIKSAIQKISTQRSDFGAYQNRLEHSYNINKNTEENTQAAESVIRDADMAENMMKYSKDNILLQAGQAMITQANQANQSVLQLLQ